ncbi:alkene reductase [Pseudomonas sp. SWRI100]|uniref:alkene reductase n=1 Tax=Pseudomonas TaxID=286 RepID=UPI00164759FA|nr:MULTISPECIES: alkene reductase [Pseudomonas]MBC3495673.1 alkene reductase [Pseudomonas sp. SWRI67]MBV4526781.1 alkene reductase [Pseudomonas kermanshahensis]
MAEKSVFEPYTLGAITLSNRIVMAPLTRNRAEEGLLPSQFAATYYSQRASAGLLITEATQVSKQAQGYQNTPGIFTQQQVSAWREVTDAVHAEGGRIFLQIWHVGRVSHVVYQDGQPPVAPSAIRAAAKVSVNNELVDVSEPRALRIEELPDIVEDFRQSAANAIKAGFDGVEIHAANGYLLDQFLKDSANKRTDAYGGSVANRARLVLEIAQAVASEIGAERTGIRISPVSPFNDVSSTNAQKQYDYLIDKLNELGLVYLHVIEGVPGGSRDIAPFDYAGLRRRFTNTVIVNNGYDVELASSQLAAGQADLFAIGRPFIANPDLVERLNSGAALASFDPSTLYGGGAAGYIDYPALENA